MYNNDKYKQHGLEIGMRVRVIRQNKYPYDKLLNKTAVVRSAYGSQVALEFEGMFNTKSSKGYYYLKPVELEIVTDCHDILEECDMAINTQKITNYLNVAKVQHVHTISNKNYTYEYANFDPHLAVGDLCIVESAGYGFDLAKVVELIDTTDLDIYQEVVARVDTEEYDRRVANRNKVAELKFKMQERAKQLQDIALYQLLAKDDPDMAELLEEYQALPKM